MLGPFDVDPSQIEALGPRFTPFVNELLSRERAAAGLEGAALTVTYNEFVADGGVDAAIEGCPGTDWLPSGDSAWQFKSGDRSPSKCSEELKDAKWAHEYIRAGGSYILVIGADLTDQKLKNRRSALRKKAVELALCSSEDVSRIEVYHASKLADWASTHRPLALSPLLGGPGYVGKPFEEWVKVQGHDYPWQPDERRLQLVQSIRATLLDRDSLRISGEPGFGKSRLVLEALQDDQLRPLVVYVADEANLEPALLNHLLSASRSTILVVDDCDAERHTKITDQLPIGSPVVVVTIGPAGAVFGKSPAHSLKALDDENIERMVSSSFPDIWAEASRFIVSNSDGNPRWALQMARSIQRGPQEAASLIDRNDIEGFITQFIPEGRDFFIASCLATLTRVGWEGERSHQLLAIATFAGATEAEVRAVGALLEDRGLLERYGRYRAVAPHPFAVFLAADLWRKEAGRIVHELLPALDEEAAGRLFERVSHLGPYDPAQEQLQRLLGPGGPFGSLATIEESGTGRQLTALAIVLPDSVSAHLARLVRAASIDELQSYVRSRRDLVWTLEKLVWHTRTFEESANSLLKLAQAEIEDYANNATGEWISLFGALLPGTAAKPPQRLDYLRVLLESDSAFVRSMVVQACGAALDHGGESITISGEVQGGAVVEQRGGAQTYGEAAEYRTSLLMMLYDLALSNDVELAELSGSAIVDAVNVAIFDPLFAGSYREVASGLPLNHVRRLRSEALNLLSLYEKRKADDLPRIEAIEALLDALPGASTDETIRTLALLNRWDMRDDDMHLKATQAFSEMDVAQARDLVTEILSETNEIPAAWDLGRALAVAFDPSLESRAVLLGSSSLPGLTGYLYGSHESGDDEIFDRFLTSDEAAGLTDSERLQLAVRAPLSDVTQALVLDLLDDLDVVEGARSLFGWRGDSNVSTVRRLIAQVWLPRISTAEAYRAVLDWLVTRIHRKPELQSELSAEIHVLAMLRMEYPLLGQQSWAWAQLAEKSAEHSPVELARLIVSLISEREVHVHSSSVEAGVLSICVRSSPDAVFQLLGEALEDGSWKLQLSGRGWLVQDVPIDVIEAWVDDDIDRARAVASVAAVGGSSPTAVTRFLLTHFGDDDKVKSSLYVELVSGSWTGPESVRTQGQIDTLTAWMNDESPEVSGWAAEVIENLRTSLDAARLRESEEDWG